MPEQSQNFESIPNDNNQEKLIIEEDYKRQLSKKGRRKATKNVLNKEMMRFVTELKKQSNEGKEEEEREEEKEEEEVYELLRSQRFIDYNEENFDEYLSSG